MQERLEWYKSTIEVVIFLRGCFSLAEHYPKQIERKLSSTAAQSQATPQGKPDRPVYLRSLTPTPLHSVLIQ
jgi:hypothetical protein